MLAKPTLSMVRLFLLLAFYMLGTNHRSAAAMYLGIATKAAVVLGLDNPRNCAPGNLTVKYAGVILVRKNVLNRSPKDHAHGLAYEFWMYLQALFLESHKICLHQYKILFR
jgi:hypothetical protein